jgi:hypothetical protein
MRALVALVLALGGCNTLLGIDDFEAPDDPGAFDELPADLTITGQLSRDDGEFLFPLLTSTPVSFHRADGSVVQSTTSDVNGTYVLVIPTDSTTLDGYVHVAATGSVFAPRRYLAGSIGNVASFHLTAYLSTRLADFASFALASQTLSTGCVIIDVVDASGAALPGAVIETGAVGQLRYHSDAVNGPSAEPTSTGAFGGGWVFGVTGRLTVSASLGARRSVARTLDVPAGTISELTLQVP